MDQTSIMTTPPPKKKKKVSSSNNNNNNETKSNDSPSEEPCFVDVEEIWEGDDGSYINSVFWELRQKKNWNEKIYNETIVAKWEKEAIEKLHMDEYNFEQVIAMLKDYDRASKMHTEQKTMHELETESPPGTSVVQKRLDLIPIQLQEEFQAYVSNNIEAKERANKDFHPGSGDLVVDLVHPSLFCYVNDSGEYITDILPSFAGCELKEKYQWIPSEFRVSNSGNNENGCKVDILSYINNLNELQHPKLYSMIAEIFGYFVPMFNKINASNVWQKFGNLPSKSSKKSRKSKKRAVVKNDPRFQDLQIIVKLANIELTPENPKYEGGSWHLEGLEHENIVGSGIYYYDVQNIEGSFLEFRDSTPWDISEAPQDDNYWVWKNYGVFRDMPANRYLGNIAIEQGTCVVFPNAYQHHVSAFTLKDKSKPGLRKILVFFLVDPQTTILSTKYVPIQQKDILSMYVHLYLDPYLLETRIVDVVMEYLPCMTMDDALKYRLDLMESRKFWVDSQNEEIYERLVSFCEH